MAVSTWPVESRHSVLKHVRRIDYYKGNPLALLAERERKLRQAAAKCKEVNNQNGPLTKTKIGMYHFCSIHLSEND